MFIQSCTKFPSSFAKSKIDDGASPTDARGTRLNEHKRHCRLLQLDKSAIAEHAIGENHHIDFDQSEIVATEDRFWPRKVKEALLIIVL